MKKFYLLLFIGSVYYCSAQTRTFSLSLFYEISQTESRQLFRLDSLSTLIADNSATLSIYGYADFLSNSSYNLKLSRQRADAVRDYLLKKKGSNVFIASCKGLGEVNSRDNTSARGEPAQRRVDVKVTWQVPDKMPDISASKIKQEVLPQAPVAVPENSEEPETEELVSLRSIDSLKKGESMTVEGLNFIPGRHLLLPKAVPVLEALLATLQSHPSLKIEIQGHVCCPGDGRPDGMDMDTQTYNLSENRAKAVYIYLVKKGIDRDRLTYKGYGRSKPKIRDERTPEDEQANRRVDIKVLEN